MRLPTVVASAGRFSAVARAAASAVVTAGTAELSLLTAGPRERAGALAFRLGWALVGSLLIVAYVRRATSRADEIVRVVLPCAAAAGVLDYETSTHGPVAGLIAGAFLGLTLLPVLAPRPAFAFDAPLDALTRAGTWLGFVTIACLSFDDAPAVAAPFVAAAAGLLAVAILGYAALASRGVARWLASVERGDAQHCVVREGDGPTGDVVRWSGPRAPFRSGESGAPIARLDADVRTAQARARRRCSSATAVLLVVVLAFVPAALGATPYGRSLRSPPHRSSLRDACPDP